VYGVFNASIAAEELASSLKYSEKRGIWCGLHELDGHAHPSSRHGALMGGREDKSSGLRLGMDDSVTFRVLRYGRACDVMHRLALTRVWPDVALSLLSQGPRGGGADLPRRQHEGRDRGGARRRLSKPTHLG
jgi:hypothetical protein